MAPLQVHSSNSIIVCGCLNHICTQFGVDIWAVFRDTLTLCCHIYWFSYFISCQSTFLLLITLLLYNTLLLLKIYHFILKIFETYLKYIFIYIDIQRIWRPFAHKSLFLNPWYYRYYIVRPPCPTCISE